MGQDLPGLGESKNMPYMGDRLKYYFKIWLLMSKNSFMGYLNNRLSFIILLTGKVLRFVFFLIFFKFLLGTTKSLAGYDLNQTLFFFLTFNLVDVVTQFLFREVYRFRPLIVDGSFDLILVKPWSSLFRSLMGGADLLDLITIPPLIIALFFIGNSLNPTIHGTMLYIALLANGILIATAFHIAVIALGIITLEIDHTIMVYRDLTDLGRLPVEIYKEPLRGVLTFIVPVGIMITFPAKAFIGFLSPLTIMTSFIVGLVAVYLSMRFWKYALRFYTSASS